MSYWTCSILAHSEVETLYVGLYMVVAVGRGLDLHAVMVSAETKGYK